MAILRGDSGGMGITRGSEIPNLGLLMTARNRSIET